MHPRELDERDILVAVQAIKNVTGCLEVLIGGRGALAANSDASPALRATLDLDIAITKEGELKGIDSFAAELGRESDFAATHGFYVEHAGEDLLTYLLPDGWRGRASIREVVGIVVLCLAPVDIALNKLNAKRPKDLDHLELMIKERIVTVAALEDAIENCPYTFLKAPHREALQTVLARFSD